MDPVPNKNVSMSVNGVARGHQVEPRLLLDDRLKSLCD